MFEHNGEQVVTANDFIRHTCDCTRQGAFTKINHLLETPSLVKRQHLDIIFGEKVPVPGRADPEYVLNHEQCSHLVFYLPGEKAEGARRLITKTFSRVRAGDQSLHAEIDARATSNDAEAETARSALSIDREEQLRSLERKRKLEELQS